MLTFLPALPFTACGGDDPSNETVVQKLDNAPGGQLGERTRYRAELGADGNYCSVEHPNLCAPARAREWACRGSDGKDCSDGSASHGPHCICCFWVPHSWPFDIECGEMSSFP
jgi:hypothetical protein